MNNKAGYSAIPHYIQDFSTKTEYLIQNYIYF